MDVTSELIGQLDSQLEKDLQREGRLGKVRRYLKGDQDLPYMPRGAKQEFKHLANRAITNWMPLIPDTYVKGLFVDGYRASRATDNAAPWDFWQANGLDARQAVAHRGALEYGTSYVLVLPGDPVPLIRPLSPLRTLAWYDDEDDEFPAIAIHRKGERADGTRLLQVFTPDEVRLYVRDKGGNSWRLDSSAAHGLGVVPLVRFRERLDSDCAGVVRPLFTMQDRVNEVVFSTLIALQYASFRQRWATGLAIPVDDSGSPDENAPDYNPNYGQPIEPFQAAVDRLWVAEDPEARFGDFAQTELSGHLEMYNVTVRTMAAIAQVSPNILTGDLVNVGAEALAQMEQSTQRKLDEYAVLFGESWEQVFRLAAKAAGDDEAARDTSAQVRWRDTEARSLAQTVDALGKLAQMLSVPVEALWEKVPGVTDQDVERWKAMRAEDPLAALTAEVARQTAALSAPDENALDEAIGVAA